MGGYKNSITDINGNVGIGTGVPTSKLEVYTGADFITASTNDGVGSANGFGYQLKIADNNRVIGQMRGVYETSASGGSGAITFFTISTGALSERMRINSSGNVGIGTTSPSAAAGTALAINGGASQARLALKNNATGNGAEDGLQLGVGTDGGAFIEQRENNYMILSTNAVERMRITSAGAIHLSQGTGNSYVGTNAGNLGTSTGERNTAFGVNSLYNNTTGASNTANGQAALSTNTTGTFNTAVGRQSLVLNTTGSNNVAVGGDALFHNTTASSNTATGYRALHLNTTGSNNTANGLNALYSNTTGSFNTANGFQALYYNTTASNNTATGYQALLTNTTGSGNVANGRDSLRSNTTGSDNVANGRDALFFNTTGNNNVAIGREALSSNTTASSSTATGYRALYLNTTGGANTATGYQALNANTTGANNTANGLNSLVVNTTGNNNVAFGRDALRFNTTGSNNTANGFQALYSNTTGGNNVAIGYNAGNALTTGSNNTIIGSVSGTAGMADTVIIAAGTTERMRIDSAGNVGIGNNNIQDFSGKVLAIHAAAGSAARIKLTTATSGVTSTDGGGITYETNNTLAIINRESDGIITFNPSGAAERMRINSSGNVGIGTSSPLQKLDVVGTGMRMSDGVYTGYFGKASTFTGSTTNAFAVRSDNDLTFGTGGPYERMRIDSSGNVGIGTSSPDVNLHIVSSLFSTSTKVQGTRNSSRAYNEVIAKEAGGTEIKGLFGSFYDNNSVQLRSVTAHPLTFSTANTERMRIDSSGNVGIGSTDPARKLELKGDRNAIIRLENTRTTESAGQILGAIEFFGNDSSGPGAGVRSSIVARTAGGGEASYLTFSTTSTVNDVEKMRLETDGDLHVDGDVIAYSTTISDQRLKDDIQTIDNALDKVSNLRGVSYTWNNGNRKGQKDLGLIAQEVEQVLPELVREKEMPMIDGETYKTVDYEKIVGVLIEAVKELKTEIEILKAK